MSANNPLPMMGGFENILGLQIQNTIIKEIIDQIKSINLSLNDTVSESFNKISYLLFTVMLILLIQNLVFDVSNIKKLFTFMKNIIFRIFSSIVYKKFTLILAKTKDKYATNKYNRQELNDYILHRKLQDIIFKAETVSYLDKVLYFDKDNKPIIYTKNVRGFPIYFYATQTINSDIIEINYEYCRIIHSKIILTVFEETLAMQKITNLINDKNHPVIKIASRESQETNVITFKQYYAEKLYQNNNLKKISNMIQDYLAVGKILETMPPLIILVNGCPGLGKTRIIDYIAYNNICNENILYDMTNFHKIDINAIFTNINTTISSKPGNYLIMIDEVDKYVDYWIDSLYQQKYDTDKDKVLAANLTPNKYFGGNNSNTSSTNDVNLMEQEKKDFYIAKKSYFLYQLLNLIESRNTNHRKIFIFTANNFWSIFNGVDMKHFDSLKDRLIKIDFFPSNKDEIFNTFNYYNSLFELNGLATKQIDPAVLRNKINQLPDDYHITMRHLYHSLVKNNYDLTQSIDNILSELNTIKNI